MPSDHLLDLSPGSPVVVSLLGDLAVTMPSHDRTPIIGRLPSLLFAFLVVNRSHAVDRDEIIDVLWSDSLPDHPRAACSTIVARLRRSLPGGMLVGRAELRLDLGARPAVDWERARDARARSASARAGGDPHTALAIALEAKSIVAQRFLGGIQGRWADDRRSELATLRASLLDAIASAAIDVGGDALVDAESAARALIADEPLRERGHRHLIHALAASGDHAAALLAFHDVRTVLRDVVGVAPSPALVRTVERLIRPPLAPVAERPVAIAAPASPPPPSSDPSTTLTHEERRVAEIAAGGAAANEIAAKLYPTLRYLTPDRVERHLARVRAKLGIDADSDLGAALRTA